MKNKLWLFQIPIVALFTSAYYITEHGFQGDLQNHFIVDQVYPKLQRVVTLLSDLKFQVRGNVAPKNKIVIVEVDSTAIDQYGRWPWHRNQIAKLVEHTFDAGAKVVGMDMVFSEPDTRVSPEMKDYLTAKGLLADADRFETDHDFTGTVFKHADHLVLGMTSESLCRTDRAFKGYVQKVPPEGGAAVKTADFDMDECPVSPNGPEVAAMFPKEFDKFSIQEVKLPENFDVWQTPLWTALTFLYNIDEYGAVAKHAAYFNVFPDFDHVIRRIPLAAVYHGAVYPSLALEMARVGLGESIDLKWNARHGIERLGFAKSKAEIPITPTGTMEINFRGPGRTFTYVSAAEIMGDKDILEDGVSRKLAGISKKEVLRDAFVLIGVTALGTNDMRAFPMDNNVSGVEGHANILDNLLALDMLVPSYRNHSAWLFALMVIGALGFAYAIQKLESVPALLLFVFVFAGMGIADFKVLFNQNISLNSAFFYIEMFSIFFFTLAVKYVIEERNKKFVRSAFAKYVAPAVVDSILEDPTKLTVGGEKKDLTIMFSDIRSFTTFSERLDAKVLASFLNDYLGIMTKIVFANEGTLDKYIGDAIMAFWGAPLDQPKHALHACQGAQAMMKALGENRARYFEQYGVDVNVGVGINSGPVNVGNMGSSDNFSYTVIGDHVNLSSRLEGLTKAYGVAILTTRFTFDEIVKGGDKLPAHRVLDNVKVKGKKNAVELIQVLERPLAEEGLVLFEQGRKLYEQQEWDKAVGKFREASSYLSLSAEIKDGPCEVYLERCQEFKLNPPAKDWDGSWEMHSK